MIYREELENKINNTIMTYWNWYDTWNSYLRDARYEWLRSLLTDIFDDIYIELEKLKQDKS